MKNTIIEIVNDDGDIDYGVNVVVLNKLKPKQVKEVLKAMKKVESIIATQLAGVSAKNG